MTKAIIIEDMPEAAASLKQMLTKHCPDIAWQGTAGTVIEGAKMIRQIEPDLIFLDIELPDGTGFDVLDIVGEDAAKVIFTTGLNDQALRAFRYAAVDYLLKPIDVDELKTAVQRAARIMTNTTEQRSYLLEVKNSNDLPKSIALHSQDRIHLITIANIIRCQAEGNYTRFLFHDAKPILVAKTLKSYSDLLEAHGFLRVHQSHLINPRYLKEFVKTDGGYLIMQGQTKVPVSVRRRAVVMNYFK